MLSAASYVGGRNVAVSMAQARNGGGSAAAHHRRLGIAIGGFGLTAEWKRANAPTKEGWRRKRERSRQKEFVAVVVMTAARHRDAGAVSGKAIMETEAAISRPEYRSVF